MQLFADDTSLSVIVNDPVHDSEILNDDICLDKQVAYKLTLPRPKPC